LSSTDTTGLEFSGVALLTERRLRLNLLFYHQLLKPQTEFIDCRTPIAVKCKQPSKYVGSKGDGNYNYDVLTKNYRFPVKTGAISLLITKTRLTNPVLVGRLSVLSIFKPAKLKTGIMLFKGTTVGQK